MTQATVADGASIDEPIAASPKYFNASWWFVVVMLSGLTMNFQLALITYKQSLGVMIFLLGFGMLILQSPYASILAILRWLPASLLGFLALASTFWSEAPMISFRLSLMLLITIWASVIISDRLRVSQFIGAFFVAFLIIVLGSLTSDHYQASTDGMALAGMTGSKNGMAYAGQLVLFGGLAIGLDPKQPMIMRLIGWASVPVSTLVMFLAKSASAFVLTGVGLGLFGVLLAFHFLRPQGRLLALLAALIIATPVATNWPAITSYAETFQTRVLKKDKTLTGRTYLWERAKPVIESRPILGHGYSSFWREGALDAEGLWRWAGVRGGFNFHNEYIETAVGLGYVGVVVLVLYMIVIGAPILFRVVSQPTIPMIFFAAIVTMMYMRTTVEVGMISCWVPQTIALLAAGIYGIRGEGMKRQALPNSTPPGVAMTPLSRPGTSG